jgi:hypothetical protein
VAIEVPQNVDDVADLIANYGVNSVLRWERSATEGGAYSEVGTTLLDANVSRYEFFDSSGTTTSWYRTRVSNSANTVQSAYYPAFQAGALRSYASLDTARELLDLPSDASDNLIGDLLVQASKMMDGLCHRSFYRRPQVTGTEIHTYDSSDLFRNGTTLVEDIVSLTTLELAWLTGGTFTALTAADWFLYPSNPKDGWPYEELRLSDVGSRYEYPGGSRVIRLTGAFGWPAVPPDIEAATRELAQEIYWKSRGGRQVGLEFGRLPLIVEKAVQIYAREPWVYGAPALAASWP